MVRAIEIVPTTDETNIISWGTVTLFSFFSLFLFYLKNITNKCLKSSKYNLCFSEREFIIIISFVAICFVNCNKA